MISKNQMVNQVKKLRPAVSIIFLVIALAVGAYYVANNRAILDHLASTSWSVTAAIFCLYIVMLGVLLLIMKASMDICGRKLKLTENAAINVYSLLINFFIPGQGGSAYRGLYLRQRHKLRIKNYIIVALLYYLLYAMVSVLLLMASSRPWWQTALAVLVVSGLGLAIIRWYSKRSEVGQREFRLGPRNVPYLLYATVLQAAVQMAIYAVELRNVSQSVSLSQIMTYTGAANLALFVSLTPGAIGVRESFLFFSERLHHISGTNIVEANVIDRAVYIVFLLALLLIALAAHVIKHQRLKRLTGPVRPGAQLNNESAGVEKSIQ
ncbi:MAG: lysylphosphatidylglycerol synthase transmembrane domain-containing protein [Thermoleophilia bacterium]